MGSFEDQLWSGLMREHRAELAGMKRPAPSRHRVHPVLLGGGGAGVATTGIVLALVLTAARTTPAFAVSDNPDGSITVTLRQEAGMTGLNAEFAKRRIRAAAVPVERGCDVTPNNTPGERYLFGDASPAGNLAESAATIYPSMIPNNTTLVLGVISLGSDKIEFVNGLVNGPAPACVSDRLVTAVARANPGAPAPDLTP